MKLADICKINMGQSPYSSTYNAIQDGLPFFQGNADFGELHPIPRIWCNAPIKIANTDDILISVRAPIGALNIADRKCCIGRGLAALTANQNICKSGYLWYAIGSQVNKLVEQGTGTTFKAISKTILEETDVPVPTIAEQIYIVSILDNVSALIALRKRQLIRLDELVKARFVEMFGDPIGNPHGWETAFLSELGYLKNGMNFHEDDSGVELYCVGVGDFQNRYKIMDISILRKISLNEFPSNEYMLQDGDILFVRSNGNKNLVGRSIAVYPGSVPTTFSGFCIRFRNTSDRILIPYLQFVLKSESVRARLTGRGVNIQNLNQTVLSDLLVPIPNLELQKRFSTFEEQSDKSRLTIRQGLDKMETLKRALMQEYFGE